MEDGIRQIRATKNEFLFAEGSATVRRTKKNGSPHEEKLRCTASVCIDIAHVDAIRPPCAVADVEPNTTTGPRFRYTGQQLIGELGLYHYKARFYSPSLGRFLQTDPIGYKDDVNLYAYVGNNPANRTDPSGLIARESGAS